MTTASDAKGRTSSQGYMFRTFKGVFTPSVLTILGVVMYLRFGWALGHMGLWKTLLMITLASSITFLTGLSLSALATNMKVEGGGAYYIISRSLGIEAGAAVGLPLFFAQALGISFYIVGFSECLVAEYPQLVVSLADRLHIPETWMPLVAAHDTQIIGVTVLLLLTALVYKSADLALRTQFIVLALITVSLVSFFWGGTPVELPVLPVDLDLTRKGFWPVFAVVFPAVTGIEAGIAMSGDLKDPARSLPRGTIAAVLVGYVVYVAVIMFLWAAVSDQNLLIGYPMMMHVVARWGMPVLLGIWAASLSSAMGALLGAPRTLQALARDRVVPQILGRGFGKGNDPRVATATAFLVGLIGVLAGDLNVIGPVLSMFFLTSYGLLNISAGLEELTAPPSWRPRFRIPWSLSLAGAFGCFAAMFMIDAGATFMAAFVAVGVYVLMERRSLRARWGDMRSAIWMLIARNAIHALSRRKTDERTWRPNILVLSGSPTSRWYLIELASAISHERGFLTVAAIIAQDTEKERVNNLTRTVEEYLDKRNVPALVKVYPAASPLAGARTLVQTYGYGPIVPNTILIGMTERPEKYQEFAELVHLINRQQQNLVIVRESAESSEVKAGSRIDIWWYGTQQNLGLMLALVYLLQRSSGWRRASLVLKTIVDDASEIKETRARLNSFIQKIRMDAEADILVRGSESVFDVIKSSSQDADLVCLGMRSPEPEESIEDYTGYYRLLLAQTEGLPVAALVLAAEDIDFYSIFDEQ